MFNYNDFVFYHMYVFSLADAPFHNDYVKTEHKLGEIAKWIPHIKGLGCNAVLLSPVLKSKSHGYDVTDYYNIDNRIGTNDEFKALVSDFHKAGMSVVLDCVFNHCGRDFFAFDELRKGNRDYAHWFSGVDFNRRSPLDDYFTYDSWSGHYELVKFNLMDEQARSYLLDSARFLIDEFDIDGMRLDSANVMELDFMRALRRVVMSIKPSFWLMGEVVSGDYTLWVNGNTLNSVTGYMLYKALFSSHNENNLYELAHTIMSSKPGNGIDHYNFLDNHDQPRIASLVSNPAFLNTLYTLLFTLPGIPSIYYGSEWGIKGEKENGSDQPLRPYIDIDDPPDETEVTRLIRKLARIRSERLSLRCGAYRQIYLEYHRPFVFEREFEGERVIVAVNISGEEEEISISGGAMLDLLTGEGVDASRLKLAPYSSGIFLAQ